MARLLASLLLINVMMQASQLHVALSPEYPVKEFARLESAVLSRNASAVEKILTSCSDRTLKQLLMQDNPESDKNILALSKQLTAKETVCTTGSKVIRAARAALMMLLLGVDTWANTIEDDDNSRCTGSVLPLAGVGSQIAFLFFCSISATADVFHIIRGTDDAHALNQSLQIDQQLRRKKAEAERVL